MTTLEYETLLNFEEGLDTMDRDFIWVKYSGQWLIWFSLYEALKEQCCDKCFSQTVEIKPRFRVEL